MLPENWILRGLVVPVGLMLIWQVFGILLSRQGRSLGRPIFLGSLCFVVAGILAYWASHATWPQLPPGGPTDAMGKCVIFLLPLLCLSTFFSVAKGKWRLLTWPTKLLLIFALGPVLLWPYVQHGTWPIWQAIWELGGILILAGLVGLITTLSASGHASSVTSFSLAGLTSLTGIIIMIGGGSIKVGLVGVTLGCVLLASWLVMAMFLPPPRAGWSADSIQRKMPSQYAWQVQMALLCIFALVIMGHYFADLSRMHALVLAGSPLLAVLGHAKWVMRKPVVMRFMLRTVIVVLPACVILGQLIWQVIQEQSSGVANPYG